MRDDEPWSADVAPGVTPPEGCLPTIHADYTE